MTTQEIAAAAYEQFERAARATSDGEMFVRIKDGAPDWIKDAVKDAHNGGEILPDDWTYERARSAFEAISEADDPQDARHEWADGEADTYTSARLSWLADYPGALDAVDEAVDEFGWPSEAGGTVAALAGRGQYIAAGRLYDAILAACEERAEEEDDEDDEELDATAAKEDRRNAGLQ